MMMRIQIIIRHYRRYSRLQCSFVEMQYPTMITGPFAPYFRDLDLPIDGFIESSRFLSKKR